MSTANPSDGDKGTGSNQTHHKTKSPQRNGSLRGLSLEMGPGGVEPPTSRLSAVHNTQTLRQTQNSYNAVRVSVARGVAG